ncbi:MAG: DUF4294 domain-containing protein [Crocinitomicaceae bacterium]|nr:DUF4294 domain-containing protein [Crocinitomicaceae bacterium]
MRQILIFLLLFSCGSGFAQEDSVAINQNVEEVKVMKNFARRYQSRLRVMRRVYPIALHAKEVLEEHQQELDGISRKRKRKRMGKKAHKSLKEEFEYNIKDLYIHEGVLLIRLVHRETGMTVAEIIEVFEGKTKRKWYSALARLGGQNLESEYDKKGDDYLTELIIQEIEAGSVSFNLEMKDVDKQAYKEGMKEYRSNVKKGKKRKRQAKRKK